MGVPHGGIPYESLTDLSGKIKISDLSPTPPLSGSPVLTSSPIGVVLATSGTVESMITTRYPPGENLSENNTVFVNASGYLQRALASGSGTLPCIGLVSVIPVSIALSGGVNVSGTTGSGISISALSGGVVAVITRGIKDSIFVGLSGVQNINTVVNGIGVLNSGINLIPISGAVPNTQVYVSPLSAGLLTTVRPTNAASGFIQRVGVCMFNSGQILINPDPFYYYPTSGGFGQAF